MAEPASGLRTIAAWQREPLVATPTWPASAPVQVATMIPVRSIDPQEGVSMAFNETTAHGRGATSADILSIQPSETWTCPMRYEGFEQLWACALGYQARRLNAVAMPEALAPGIYRHLFEVDDGLSTALPWTLADGFTAGELATPLFRVRRGTAAVWRQVSVWELLSAMVDSVTFSASIDVGMSAQWRFVGFQRRRDSVVNTIATLQALPANAAPNILKRHEIFRLAPQSLSTALQAGNRLRPRSWQLTINNNLTAAPGPRTWPYPEEYERSASPTLTLLLDFPRYTDDAAFQRLLGATPLMADLRLTGPAIRNTGYAYQCNLSFPQFHLREVTAPVQGPGVASYSHQALLEVPAQQPAGFVSTHHLGPVYAELVNTVAAHALLD